MEDSRLHKSLSGEGETKVRPRPILPLQGAEAVVRRSRSKLGAGIPRLPLRYAQGFSSEQAPQSERRPTSSPPLFSKGCEGEMGRGPSIYHPLSGERIEVRFG